jgi:hypothetical protein
MSSFIIFLYSKQVPQIQALLNQVLSFDFVHTLCIDNDQVRRVMLASPILKTKSVPCFVVIYPDQTVVQYLGTDMIVFLRKLAEARQQQPPSGKIDKSPISAVIDTQSVNEPLSYPQPSRDEDLAVTSNPSFNVKTESNNASLSKQHSNKNNVGEVINYTKEKNFRTQPVQKESSSFQKGNGHDGMARSSLRETQNKSSEELDVIEDIFENENSSDGLINFSKEMSSETTSAKSNNSKKVSDVKNLINEMMAEREKHMESKR